MILELDDKDRREGVVNIGTGDNILKPSSIDIDVNLLRLQIKALNEKLSKQADELEKYKKALEIAKDKLEFYGDTHSNYTFLETEKDYNEYHIEDRWMLDVDDDYEQMGNRVQWGVTVPKMVGGKRARQALKEIEEVLKNE